MDMMIPSTTAGYDAEALLEGQFPDLGEFETTLDPDIFANPSSPTAVVPDQDSARALSPSTPTFSDIGDASLKELLGTWGDDDSAVSASASVMSPSLSEMINIEGLAHDIKQEQELAPPPPAPPKSTKPRSRAKISPKIEAMFSKETLRCSADEWKTYRKKIRTLTKDEQQQVSSLRRKELSCVYAEKARQRRIRNLREGAEDNAKLKKKLVSLEQKYSSLARELARYKAKFG